MVLGLTINARHAYVKETLGQNKLKAAVSKSVQLTKQVYGTALHLT